MNVKFITKTNPYCRLAHLRYRFLTYNHVINGRIQMAPESFLR